MGSKWIADDRLDDLSQTVVQQAHQARHLRRGGMAVAPYHASKRLEPKPQRSEPSHAEVFDIQVFVEPVA